MECASNNLLDRKKNPTKGKYTLLFLGKEKFMLYTLGYTRNVVHLNSGQLETCLFTNYK